MGEEQGTLFRPDLNRSIRVEARAERLSGDAGALLLREVAERLGYRRLPSEALTDNRDPERIRHPFGELLLTDLLLRAEGWTDHRDATLLRHDPLLRLAVSERRGEAPIREAAAPWVPDGLASQPILSRFLGMLAEEHNRDALGRALLDSNQQCFQTFPLCRNTFRGVLRPWWACGGPVWPGSGLETGRSGGGRSRPGTAGFSASTIHCA